MTQTAGNIEVNHGGTIHRASYSVKNGKVHILTPLGNKSPKPLGSSKPEEVARLMLKEVLHERDNKWSPVKRPST
jgi:hypothetical protein